MDDNREPVRVAMSEQSLGYPSRVEWTPARIRLLREVGLCQSQHDFAKTLGVAKRTIGNAERGTHPPSLAVRRALDDALEHASNVQRDRFHSAITTDHRTAQLISADRGHRGSHASQVSATHRGSAVAGHPIRTLDGLRSAVLGTPPSVPMGVSAQVTRSAADVVAATVQAHRSYQLADYDTAAQLLPAIVTHLRSRVGTDGDPDECLAGTLTTQHAAAAAYLVAAKLATKLGDVGLASVTADRAMTAAEESEHLALIGATTYQVACALLLTGELADAEQILTVCVDNIASVAATPHLNCRQEEALSVQGSLLLLLAIMAAQRGDHNGAQAALRDAGQLAGQLGCEQSGSLSKPCRATGQPQRC